MSETTGMDAGGGATQSVAPESYESAVDRLEEIILRLDSGKAELRETLELCREGKALVQYCKAELDAVSGELQRLDLDDLVRKLEATPEAAEPDRSGDEVGPGEAT